MNIVLKGISKRYNGSIALNDCDMLVSEGVFNAIIGSNASGKSTLLRIASLLEEPDRGEVIYRDSSVVLDKDITLRKKISVVLPGDSLFNDSVFNNIAYGLKIRKEKKDVVRDKVQAILKKVQLEGKARKRVKELSSGEAQRVAVARALVIGPKFLFLDEPTASLDPLNTEIIETILQEVNRSINMTILMVTHNMFQAKRIARRIIFVHNGRIVEEAGSEQFFSNPDNELTRKFLNGTMVW
jgi:tungstate transport system ATP-binding protein